MRKLTPQELREQFDQDVERFSNIQAGQNSIMDSVLVSDLMEKVIKAMNPNARTACDIGCGAGNYALRVLRQFPEIELTLIDLSPNMLDRAVQRITEQKGKIKARIEGDIRNVALEPEAFDVMTAAAVLHHLRSRQEWDGVMRKIYRALKPGGMFWLWDLVKYDDPRMQAIQYERYADYLIEHEGAEFQKMIFERVEESDTPENTPFIFQKMLEVGFKEVDIFHKNALFCGIYGRK